MNCKACKFFYITWDKKFPYGCKLYEIKSKTTPEVQVLVNTSIACLGYQPKINKSGVAPIKPVIVPLLLPE